MPKLYFENYETKSVASKGNLQWDYNAFLNLSTGNADDYYKYTANDNGSYLLSNNGKYEKFTKDEDNYIIAGDTYDLTYVLHNFVCKVVDQELKPKTFLKNTYKNEYALTEFDTEKVNFDVYSPESIEILPSYDGTVNLIINDGENQPMMVNSRFTVEKNGTYEIVDRTGTDDTNIYHTDTFNTDVSLFKTINTIAKIKFNGVFSSGNLPVGNYVFYFTLSDEDNNETDFIGESSVVTCHKGSLLDPFSIEGGIADENSRKSVTFTITNLDSSYAYVNVYYSRQTSDATGVNITKYYKVDKKYKITDSNSVVINITGYEDNEDIQQSDINPLYSIATSAKTQAICSNILFLGNITKNSEDYDTLRKLSLQFLPRVTRENIGFVDSKYKVAELNSNNEYYDSTVKGEYYNVHNIYHRTGYWNGEIYRLGVVYLYANGEVSSVYNIRGKYNISDDTTYHQYSINNVMDATDNILNEVSAQDENDLGVFRINTDLRLLEAYETYALGINIMTNIDPKTVITELKKQGIVGMFFVRQKRLATTLCLAITQGYDKISYLPMLYSNGLYYTESFINSERLLVHDFSSRLVSSSVCRKGLTAICPEYELNLSKYNSIFTASKFRIKPDNNQYSSDSLTIDGNHFYPGSSQESVKDSAAFDAWLLAIPDGTKAIRNYNNIYSSSAGDASEAWRIKQLFAKNSSYSNTNITRGNWGPYLGIEYVYSKNAKNLNRINIMIPDYNEGNLSDYFLQRFLDASNFYTISDRISLDEFLENSKELDEYDNDNNITYYSTETVFRGDCYICNYTHRMMRNFQDPSFPTTDDILDNECWKDGYTKSSQKSDGKVKITSNDDNMLELDSSNSSDLLKINRSDVNAIKMGHWFTAKYMATDNLCMRSNDSSNITEYATNHKPRSFYPLYPMSTEGTNKAPESSIFNSGYGKTTGERYYHKSNSVYENHRLSTRVMYSLNRSDTSSSYKNNFRVFLAGNYLDYSSQYGELTALREFNGYLICVFEHAVGYLDVNEKSLITSQTDGNIYAHSSKVLSEKPRLFSSMYGSQWGESVIKTSTGIYGVDTVAKKIWRCTTSGFEVLSDLHILQFLNNNITLTELEVSPIIGVRNVKSHYNEYKKDIMFTFYDDLNALEETVWNICYNELTKNFETFYSWVPSYSANINNVYFSFDRQTSKDIAELNDLNHYLNIDNHILNDEDSLLDNTYYIRKINYTNSSNYSIIINNSFRSKEFYNIITDKTDKLSTAKHPSIYSGTNLSYYLIINKNKFNDIERIPINIIEYVTNNDGEWTISKEIDTTITVCTLEYKDKIQNYFWKHGQAGLMQLDSEIKPTNWYGKQHPFEFEFVVHDYEQYHKIWNNLTIISNKAEPESLHFEVVGESYNFAEDKKNMFVRLEATKHLYLYNGADINYDDNYKNITPKQKHNDYYNYNAKSTIFPLRVSRQDSLNEIYDSYLKMTSSTRDYEVLAGSEILYDKTLNEYRISTHMPVYRLGGYKEVEISEEDYNNYKLYTNIPTKISNGKYYKLVEYGRRLGNAEYVEDEWKIQIPTINFSEKNEENWEYPPLNVYYNPVPEDLEGNTEMDIPEDCPVKELTNKDWGDIKQTKIRDKYIKIKVRYSGKDLAIIAAILTDYTISLA